MGDSADTAREKQAAKKVPKKKKPILGPSAAARSFGAHTAIFVPPELQHEQGAKPKPTPPKSVVIRVPQRTESTSEKRARLAKETAARERLRLGLKIHSPTGANDTRAVPDYVPPSKGLLGTRKLLGLDVWDPMPAYHLATAINQGIQQGAHHVIHDTAPHVLKNWGEDVAAIPAHFAEAALSGGRQGPRMGAVPPSVQKAGATAGTLEPLARPVGKVLSEGAASQVLGTGLVNLAQGQGPKSKKDVAGLGIDVAMLLPFGKFAKLGELLKLAKPAEGAAHLTPLADSTERDVWKSAIAQRVGPDQVDDIMRQVDSVARATHADDPNQFFVQNVATADKAADFLASPAAKTARFQTDAGVRRGLIEGDARWMDHPEGDFIPGPGDHVRFQSGGGGIGQIESVKGTTATIKTEGGKVVESWRGDLVPVVPDPAQHVPVFYSPLQRKVAETIPPEGLTKTETIKALAPNKKPTSTKEAEWVDAGMKDFFDHYSSSEKIPKADIQAHLSTSLNAYNLDEIIRSSDSLQFPAKWGDAFKSGVLVVKQPSKAEPYYEIAMKLRTPLRERVKKTAAGMLRVTTPYSGTGLSHWGEGDVIGHVRFHIITDTEGRKALLVEEIQSDWASQYREFMAAGGNEGIDKRVEQIRRELEVLAQDLDQAMYHSGDQGLVDQGQIEEEISKLQAERDHLQKLKDDVAAGAPPLGKKQMEAIVRRTVRFAHDANVDRVIVTPGDVQAVRNTAFAKTPRGRAIDLTNHALPIDQQVDQVGNWSVDVAGMTHEEIRAYALAHKDSGAAATFFRLYDRDIPAMFAKEMGEKTTLTKGIFKGRYSDGPGALPTHGSYEMDGHVIEMTSAAKNKAAKPMSYYQTALQPGDLPKGAAEFFADGTRAVHLFETADVSTILHELAHISVEDLKGVDREILNRHFGGFKTEADHEAYARAMERYFYEGQAMESELDPVFARIKAWMGQVYLHVNNIGGHVHPEVKQVFDRMFVKPETPAQQLVRMLESAPKIRRAQEAGYSAERGVRAADLMEAWDREGGAKEFQAAMHTLYGELPKEEFNALDDLTPEAVDALVKAVRNSNRVRPLEKARAAKAIIRATEGSVPTKSELLLLNRVFHGEAKFKQSKMGTAEKLFVEIWNIPRSLSASFDLSAPLRQGFIAGTRHPIVFAKAFKPMFEALFSAERAEEIAAEIAQRENFVHYGRGHLAVETGASNVDLAMREEQFYSSYAEQFIPPVKWSGRAYEAFLHRLRADIFDLTMEAGRAAGRPVESADYVEGLGRMVNQMTGRGVLPETELFRVETAAPLLNTFLFSPRLLASRVNMISPVYYYKLYKSDPFLFAEATKNLMTTVAAVGVVLGTVTAIGKETNVPISVGWDPTSANFGKIRVGDTRIDIMAGFSPLLVFLSREILGRSTSSTTGKSQNLQGGFGHSSRLDIAFRFAQSKAAPSTSVILDWMRNSTFVGDPVTPVGELKNSSSPMMVRDVIDAWRSPKDPVDAAVAGGMALALGTFGIGVSTYAAKKPKSRGGSSSGGSGSLLDQLPTGGGGSMLDELPSGPSGSMLDQVPSSSGGSLLGP